MGKALVLAAILLVIAGAYWAATCVVVWAICRLMHWEFTLAAGTAAWLALLLIGWATGSKGGK